MHRENLLAPCHIRSTHHDLAVKPARTHNGRVQDIHTIGGRHNNDSLVDAKSVHLHQHLVQGLLSFIVSATHTGSSAPCHSVNLVNKNDTWRVFLRILKQVTNAGSSDTDKHLNEIRTGNTEKWYPGLSCNGLGQKRLTGSGRSHQKHSLRNAGSKLRIFAGFLQEINNFFQFFLLFSKSGHIFKTCLVILIRGQLCTIFAKIHHLAAAVVGRRIVTHDHKQNEQRSEDQQIRQKRHDPALCRDLRNCVVHITGILHGKLQFVDIRGVEHTL